MVPGLVQRYAGKGEKGRGGLLDEVCELFGYSRKRAIKSLPAEGGWGGKPAVCKGRPPV